MRITLKKFGDILVSRPAGREAYLAMSAYTTKGLDRSEPIEVDFEGVKVLAPSWADEVLTALQESFDTVTFINTDNSSVKATLKTLEQFPTSVA